MYWAEHLACKPALIIQLTGCQANKIQNKQVSKNGWNIWSHCEEQQSWKTMRQDEDGYLWISQLLHFQGRCQWKRGRCLSGSKTVQLKEVSSQINWLHKTNQTQQAWTLLCLSLGQPYFFLLWHLIPTAQRHSTARLCSRSSLHSQPHSRHVQCRWQFHIRWKRRNCITPLSFTFTISAVIVEKPQKHFVPIWKNQQHNAYISNKGHLQLLPSPPTEQQTETLQT